MGLLLQETGPPRQFGQYDFYVVMVQMARIPEDKLKPLFDATQWRTMQRQLDGMRGMEQWLSQTGVLDGGPEVAGDPKPEPAVK